MAVAFIQEFDIVDGDTSTSNYDNVTKQLGDLKSIDGLICHSAGFDHDSGVFRIFDVWENSDVAKTFYDGTLGPILEKMMAGDASATPPQREATYELHDEFH